MSNCFQKINAITLLLRYCSDSIRLDDSILGYSLTDNNFAIYWVCTRKPMTIWSSILDQFQGKMKAHFFWIKCPEMTKWKFYQKVRPRQFLDITITCCSPKNWTRNYSFRSPRACRKIGRRKYFRSPLGTIWQYVLCRCARTALSCK